MDQREKLIPTLLLVVLALGVSSLPEKFAPKEQLTLEHITPSYSVESLYLSMQGPEYTNRKLFLLEDTLPELLWVTGYEATMTAEDGDTSMPQEFMCHNTLSIHRSLDEHRKLFGASPYGTRRLFTLSQGQYALQLPKGFAIPVVSTEQLMLQSQVLNLNEDAIGEKVRHKIKAHFVRDSEKTHEFQPLCMFPSGIIVRVGDPDAAEMPDDPELGCAVSAEEHSPESQGTEDVTAHWFVRPGREVRSTKLGHHFPFDTTVHYISVHLHPFAESLEFRDITTGQSLWKAEARQSDKRVGLESLSHYSSPEGIAVFKDHEYELVSTYNNSSGEDQTAMAFMFFYVLDKGFHPPTQELLFRSDESFCRTNSNSEMLR